MLARRSLVLALAMMPVFAAATAAQDACRGWSTTCAAVEVRTDESGERLILFAPNIPAMAAAATEETPAEPASDRLTVRPATGGEMAMPTASEDESDSCDEHAEARVVEADQEDHCDPAVGALFLLALPPALYALGPGGDGPLVQTPDGGFPNSPPTSTPGSDDSGNDDGSGNGAGQGGSNDGGTYDTPGDGSDDGAVGDDGSDADDGSDDGSSGGNANSTPGGSGNGGTGGDSGGGTGGSPGVGDPYHPGAQDLPPISQVPEPVSTTLFGLGLAGYAGAALRRRRAGREEEATDRA